jgi:hypothetical protein
MHLPVCATAASTSKDLTMPAVHTSTREVPHYIGGYDNYTSPTEVLSLAYTFYRGSQRLAFSLLGLYL